MRAISRDAVSNRQKSYHITIEIKHTFNITTFTKYVAIA